MQAIYKITNTANDNFYVGSSVNVKARFSAHRRDLRCGDHHCVPLQKAWDKYGAECFEFAVIEEMPSAIDLHAAENRWLKEHYGKSYCYNTGTNAGAAFLGKSHGNDAKRKVSEAQKGKRHRLGHTNSPDHRDRISSAMKGKKKSPEHVEKIRQRMMGTSYAKGRVATNEMRARHEKPVVEVTSGMVFPSVKAAAAFFELDRPNVSRALRNNAPLKRGAKAGLYFQYALPKPTQ